MKIRYQADADLNQNIVSATIRLEPTVDFRTSHAAGLPNLEDSEVLETAARDSRILVSHDKATMPDAFARFITKKSSPGVLLIPRGLKLLDVAEELVLIWAASEPNEWANRIVFIPL
jgi:predicted nuclease of predicted toxin-antitoxin system